MNRLRRSVPCGRSTDAFSGRTMRPTPRMPSDECPTRRSTSWSAFWRRT